MRPKQIAVIGAGLGGLATALRLSHRGHRVTVFEKNREIGGRAASLSVEDCRFDGGATLLMMLDPFRKLFADVGESFDELIPNKRCDPSYRVFYADGKRVDATTDVPEMTERIRKLAGSRDADRYAPFLAEISNLYHEAVPNFVRSNFRTVGSVAAPAQLRRVVKHRMLGNLAQRVNHWFDDEHVKILFSFQTMYLGLSPFRAPWVYATLAYMEYGEGIFYPEGGLVRIIDTVARLAQDRGTEIRLGRPVADIDGRNVILESGEVFEADAVVANADMPYVQTQLAQESPRRSLRYSCSTHMMYIAYDGELPELEHHNVFFGADFKGNLDSIFEDLDVPRDPAFYACISKKSDPSVCPDGVSNLMILVPIPNLDRPLSKAELERVEADVFRRLAERGGFDAGRVRAILRRGPSEWKEQLNLERGATFGVSHDLFQSAFMRPKNRSNDNPDLYFVGASTVPGNGLPMVLISAELVEDRMQASGVFR